MLFVGYFISFGPYMSLVCRGYFPNHVNYIYKPLIKIWIVVPYLRAYEIFDPLPCLMAGFRRSDSDP